MLNMKFCIALLLFLLTCSRIIEGQRNGDVRLYDGFTTSNRIRAGRLEIYITGRGWGTVCHSSSNTDSSRFGEREARIACLQLGYTGGITFGSVYFFYGFLPTNNIGIFLDNVNCSDVPLSLSSRFLQCSHSGLGVHDCSHFDDVAIQCHTGQPLRLVSNTGSRSFPANSGRLEIYGKDEEWGTVCSSGFGSNEATVACRQMGFDGYTAYGSVGSLGYAPALRNVPILLSDVHCLQSDTDLEDCSHSGINNSCSHSEDLALRCFKAGSLRLQSNSTFNAGRLEIYLNGQWGTVCDNQFSLCDATVACEQLGYSGATSGGYGNALSLGYTSASSSVPIWRTDLLCTSQDTLLGRCAHNSNEGSCTHSRDVAVICADSHTSPIICSDEHGGGGSGGGGSGGGGSSAVSVGAGVGVSVAVIVCIGVVCCICACIAANKKRRQCQQVNTQQANQDMAPTAVNPTPRNQQMNTQQANQDLAMIVNALKSAPQDQLAYFSQTEALYYPDPHQPPAVCSQYASQPPPYPAQGYPANPAYNPAEL